MITAMLYHCDSLEDIYKLNELDSGRLREYIAEEKMIKEEIECETAEEEMNRKNLLAEFKAPEKAQLLDEFSLIAIKLNKLLDWMISKLNGSKEFSYEIEELASTAQSMLDSRIVQKEQDEVKRI